MDIDFELRFVADLKTAIGEARGRHPFSGFVDPSASAHTGFLANVFATIPREATDALRPQYGRSYGFEKATPPNAEMAACTIFEYRRSGGRARTAVPEDWTAASSRSIVLPGS